MLFRHPHLLRGIVHTSHGAFVINRGLADLPEEIGDALGWIRVEGPGDAGHANKQRDPQPPNATHVRQGR